MISSTSIQKTQNYDASSSTTVQQNKPEGLKQIPNLWSKVDLSKCEPYGCTLSNVTSDMSITRSKSRIIKTQNIEPVIDLSKNALKSKQQDHIEPQTTEQEKFDTVFNDFYDPMISEKGREDAKSELIKLMLNCEYELFFTRLPVETFNKFIKKPGSTNIETIYNSRKMGGAYNLSNAPPHHKLSIKSLMMFGDRAEFWGVVKADDNRRNPFFNLIRGFCGPKPEIEEHPAGIGVMHCYLNDMNTPPIVRIGRFDSKGRIQGQGIVRVPKLGVFEGTFRDGYPHGKGCLYYENGDRFEGGYDHGVSTGSSKFTSNEGTETKSKVTIHGIMSHVTTRELDPNLKARIRAHQEEPTEEQKIKNLPSCNLDGTLELGGEKYKRVDGGYLSYKHRYHLSYAKKNFFVSELKSMYGDIEKSYRSKYDDNNCLLRSVYYGDGELENVDRGSNRYGKKKKQSPPIKLN